MVKIKSSINKGLSDNLKDSFPNTIPTLRPEVKFSNIPDPFWLSGFREGEGYFGVEIYKSEPSKGKYSVTLRFILTQNNRDYLLLSNLVNYFGCGHIKENRENNITHFYVSNLDSINSIILPFFEKYPLQGSKKLDLDDFHKIAVLMNEKKHLTTNGLELIKKIKDGMNKSRIC